MTRDSSGPLLPVDWGEAQRFHELIHGSRETEFRLLKPDAQPVRMWGSLNIAGDQLVPLQAALQRLNSDRYGVFAVVNTPHPQCKARIAANGSSVRDADIIGVNALFVELDGHEETDGARRAQLLEAEAPPSLVVQSSTCNRIHGYWLVDEMPLDLWRHLQWQMIERFGGDPACKNPSRVMRIPGFWHMKREPIQSRIISSPGTRYSTLELVDLLGLDTKTLKQPVMDLRDSPRLRSRFSMTRYVIAALRHEHQLVSMATEGARNKTLHIGAVKLGSLVGAGMLARNDAEDVLLDACRHNGLPEREARATIRSGLSYGEAHPRQLKDTPS